MVSYLTVIAVGSSLMSFLGLLLLLWGADADLRPLMVVGLLALLLPSAAWSIWILVFIFASSKAKLTKTE